MLGLNDKSWLIEMLDGPVIGAVEPLCRPSPVYDAYFGLGHSVRLEHRADVFRVSLAGMSLGACLLRNLSEGELGGRILDIGTGSGALACLLRSMGASDIVACDVSAGAVALAASNELLNFENARIRYAVSDLFEALPSSERYDTIVFNPPGWRTPSERLSRELERLSSDNGVPPGVMFCGDKLLVRFLNELPCHLAEQGRAIVGMNSLVGIRDVINQHERSWGRRSPLRFRLLERHTFPLLLYSERWKTVETLLLDEFADWQARSNAAFSVDAQGRLFWSYEVVECRLTPRELASAGEKPRSSATQ